MTISPAVPTRRKIHLRGYFVRCSHDLGPLKTMAFLAESDEQGRAFVTKVFALPLEDDVEEPMHR